MGSKFFALACALAWVQSAALTAQNRRARPDVFLITVDTLRADHLHCYGYEKIRTPALDGLARDGTRFAQAFTPSPITNTSHASILTGLLPSTHGVTDFASPLLPTHSTWAQMLKKDGYRTAAFIGAIILDSRALAPGFDAGFDYYDNFPEQPRTKSRWGRVERRGLEVVQRAESWLTAHQTGPRFVWLHLYDPHDPYEPPEPYSQTYEGRLYDGEIAYADSALGHFVAFLKQHGQYRNALIVVVGDHGEGLGEHQEDTHGIFLYDSTAHVPLILKQPDSTNARRLVNAQVRTTDILPTVLELLHIPFPSNLDGESLTPFWTEAGSPGRVALGETDYPLRFGWAPLRSVRAEGFKFIEAPRPELYDLQSDPEELLNRYEPWNARVQRLREQLAEIRARTPSRTISPGAIGAATIAELKALGYLGPADRGSATNVPAPSLLPDPKDKIVEQNLLHEAMLAADGNRPARAREALEKVLRLDPESYPALTQLGELELGEGQYAGAVAHFKRSRELRPDDAATAYYEGQALERTRDFAGARDALEDSLKRAPGQFQARLLLGQVYMKLKDTNAASDQFEAALLLQPKSNEAQRWLAQCYIEAGKFEDAIARLQQLSRRDTQDPAVYLLLAQAYSGVGKKTEAQQAESRAKLLQRHNSRPEVSGVR